MQRSRYFEEKRTPPGAVCPQLCIGEAASHAWKKKFAQLGVGEVRRLRQLETNKRNHPFEAFRSVAETSLLDYDRHDCHPQAASLLSAGQD